MIGTTLCGSSWIISYGDGVTRMVSASALLPHVLAGLRPEPHIPRPMAPVINRRGLGKVRVVQGTPGLAGTGAVKLWTFLPREMFSQA